MRLNRLSARGMAIAGAALLVGCGGQTIIDPGSLRTTTGGTVPEQRYRAAMAHVGSVRDKVSSASFEHARHALDIGGALPATTVNVAWQVIAGGGVDRMTTVSSSERNSFTSEGQSWYLPAANGSGTAPLYRLFRGNDHMDSPTAGEGGFSTDGILAFPYTDGGRAGTVQIERWVNPSSSNNDHATPSTNMVLPSAYHVEGPLNFGYPRFGRAATSLVQFSGGGVAVQLNQVAGASVWSWIWNGVQFVNTHDYGREIQSAFFYGNENPTEAGDGAFAAPQDMHGSPVASLSYTPDGMGIRSNTVPLDFNPATFGDGTDQTEVYTQMQLGKQIELNYNGLGPVAQYTTSLTLPNAVSGASLEIPTGYLQSSFNTFFTFDAASSALAQVYPPICDTNANIGFVPPSGHGGVIISNLAQNAAMGVYGSTTAVGGPASYFTLWDFTNNGCGYQTSKWDIVATGNFPAGTSTYTSYVVTGTLAQVQQLMRTLYTSSH